MGETSTTEAPATTTESEEETTTEGDAPETTTESEEETTTEGDVCQDYFPPACELPGFTCSSLSEDGLCDSTWESFGVCVDPTHEEVKDTCRISCNNCNVTTEADPCNPDPCNTDGATGEVCDAGICYCGDAICANNEVCNAGICGNYLKLNNPNNIINIIVNNKLKYLHKFYYIFPMTYYI